MQEGEELLQHRSSSALPCQGQDLKILLQEKSLKR